MTKRSYSAMHLGVVALVLIANLAMGAFARAAGDQCSDIFQPTRQGFVGRILESERTGSLVRGSINLYYDFKEIGVGRVLFRPTKDKPVAAGWGFLTDREQYYAGDGWFFKTLKTAWQFVPRRVIGLIRGEGERFQLKRFARGQDGRLRGLIYGDSRYTLTFMSGLKHTFLDAPVYKMSDVLNLKRRYVSSLALSLSVLGGGSTLFQMHVVDPYLEARNERIVAEALEKATAQARTELIRSIRYDIRNRDLRDLWIQSVGDARTQAERRDAEETILEAAQIRSISNRTFFETYRSHEFVATRENVGELVKYPQFSHLQSYAPVDPAAAFDAKLWKNIFYLNWTFQVMIEVAPDFVVDSKELHRLLEKDLATRDVYSRIYGSAFMREVREMYRQKQITREEAASLIGQDLYYRTRMAEQRLLTGSSGDISIEDLEAEMLATAVSGRARWNIPDVP